MLAVAPTNGAVCCFTKTTLPSYQRYNQIRVSGTLNGSTLTGSYTADAGTNAVAIYGTVAMVRQ